MLAEANGGPIDYQGRNVMMSYRIPILNGQEFQIEVLHYKNDLVEQGFEVSVDQRKGLIYTNGQKLRAPVFWMETAPITISFICYTSKANGILNIWNVWRTINRKDSIEAWIGHAGLYIEEDGKNAVVIHCSNGIHQVDFSDLVLRMEQAV